MIRRYLKIGLLAAVLVCIGIVVTNELVEQSAKDRVFNSTREIPSNKVGLLLGTAKYLGNGHKNLYYLYRIDAAVRLYKAGKIKYILVSGDNGNKNYDEPTDIKNDLMAKGVPEDRIYLDYAGFRTLDSVVRSKEIFGQKKVTVISQQFHNERAIFIANMKGVEAVGYNAKDVGGKFGLRVKIRERLARVKMMLDLIFGKEPKFLGEKIQIS
ncbi:MAG: protein SanA [Crocinitomicaceae bacterium]|nr:protein SanA [Crocinitomicaceae bacterium]